MKEKWITAAEAREKAKTFKVEVAPVIDEVMNSIDCACRRGETRVRIPTDLTADVVEQLEKWGYYVSGRIPPTYPGMPSSRFISW